MLTLAMQFESIEHLKCFYIYNSVHELLYLCYIWIVVLAPSLAPSYRPSYQFTIHHSVPSITPSGHIKYTSVKLIPGKGKYYRLS